jgi:2-dehydro-3-deoxygalactonokinase
MMPEDRYCDWVAVDWGTSRLRAWAMRGTAPIASASSDNGMGTLDRNGFEPALLDLVGPWLGRDSMPMLVCGMAGSRQGWAEAPYATVPCAPAGLNTTQPPVTDTRLSVHILPGLKQMTPPDVMRGEEIQIAGFLGKRPGFDGVLCLPGTHTKWVQVSAGEVVSFRTFMTGEMFALLTTASVLRHSVGPGWDAAAFEAALADTLSRPENLAARLFSIRASGLIGTGTPAEARSRISGLLIGAELAASRPYWLGQSVAVIGAREQAEAYVTALALQGLAPEQHDADEMTLAGLAAAHQALKETVQ